MIRSIGFLLHRSLMNILLGLVLVAISVTALVASIKAYKESKKQ